MRTNNANFEAANSSASKSLRLVIAIHFDEFNVIYFTSDSDITITGETTVDDVLRRTSSTSQRINPVAANATIGAISFELLDYAEAVTDVFREQLQDNDNGLKGKKVELYLGYEGLAWSDYRLEQTQIIDKQITYIDGIYNVSCRDVQRETRKDILEPAKTRLSASVSVGVDTIQVFDTSGFNLVPHGTSYSHAPSETLVYFKIKTSSGYEICSATGMTATQFTGVTRGLFGTLDQAHDVGSSENNSPEVIEYIYLEMPAVKLAYALLTGSLINQGADVLPDTFNLGVDPAWVDIDSFTGIGTDLYDATDDTLGRKLRFEGLKKTDGKRFLEQQILLIIGCVLRVLPNGKLSLTRVGGVLTGAAYVAELNETNITKYSALRYDQSIVRNRLDIHWSWVELQNGDKDFYRTHTLIDGNSITRYGETGTKELKFYGLHSEVHTTSIIQGFFNAFRDRVAGPAERLTLDVLPSMNNLEVGDIVRANNSHIRDHTGLNTLDRSMEIQGRTINQLSQSITLELFGSTQQASLLSESAGSTNELPDNWYCFEGINLETMASITSGSLDEDVTLPGDPSISNAIYFYLGDLVIPTGVTLTITENVELRVMGFLTINGTIDGKGRGLAGRTGAVPEVPESYQGRVGFLGDTKPGGAIYAAVVAFQQEEAAITRGQYSEFPDIPIQNLAGTFLNVIDDLRGTSGGQGWDSFDEDRHDYNTSYPKAPGGNGGNGGAGLRIVCRGMGFGVAGIIDLSGDDGAVSQEGTGLSEDIYGGAGAGGAPGGLDIWIDGTSNTVPALYSANFHAFLGDSPTQGAALKFGMITLSEMNEAKPASSYFEGYSTFNYGISAARIRYVPQSELTYPIFACGGSGGGEAVAAWKYALDETSGTTAADSGSSGADLTYGVDANTSGFNETGLLGNRKFFNGDITRVLTRAPEANLAHLESSFSIEFEARTVENFGGNTANTVVGSSNWDKSQVQWEVRLYDGIATQNRLDFAWRDAGDNGLYNESYYFDFDAYGLHDEASWFCIVMDWANTELRFYIDNVLVNTQDVSANSGNWYSTLTAHQSLYIGALDASTGVGNPFKGWLDEVAIYNEALSDTDRTANYNNWLSGGAVTVTPSLSISPDTLTEAASNGSHTTASVTATPTDITPVTWEWSFVSGSPDISIDTPAAATTTFSSTGYDINRTAIFKVRATDVDDNWVEAIIEVSIHHGQQISIVPANITENVANGANTTATVTAAANNLIEPVTYEWQRIYGTSEIIATAPNSDTTAFSSTGTDIAYSAQFRVTATDANNDQVSTTISVAVIHGTLS